MSSYCSSLRSALFLLCCLSAFADSNSIAPLAVCNQHGELIKRGHMKLGVRISTGRPALAKEFRRALDFWTHVLDMEWYEDDSDSCSLQLMDAEADSLDTNLIAEAENPGSADFQGTVVFAVPGALSRTEMYYYSVHEIGHLLGLQHNPNHRSVMYFEEAPGPEALDGTDLTALAAMHKMRVSVPNESIYLKTSLWTQFSVFQDVKERVLRRGFETGFAALGTGKRHHPLLAGLNRAVGSTSNDAAH